MRRGYRLGLRGRQFVVGIPGEWVDDLHLKRGDRLDVYRDTADRLIIQAARPEQKDDLPFGAGEEAKR